MAFMKIDQYFGVQRGGQAVGGMLGGSSSDGSASQRAAMQYQLYTEAQIQSIMYETNPAIKVSGLREMITSNVPKTFKQELQSEIDDWLKDIKL